MIAAPLWRRQYTTFGDLFRERYSPGVERLAVMLMVPTSVLWAAAQIRAFGQVVSAASDLEVSIAITAAAAFVIIYTVAGGLLADVVTDFIQGIAVIVGLVVLLIAIGNAYGGVDELVAMIDTERLALFSTRERHAASDHRSLGGAGLRLVARGGDAVADSRLQDGRSRAQRNASSAPRSTSWSARSRSCIGLVGPKLVPGLEEPEQLVTVLAEQHLSTFVYVMFAGALISAILSTVDSCLLAAASLVSHNIVVPLAPALSERGKIWCARGGVISFGVLAYVIALYAGGIYELVATASAFGSAGIFIVGMFGLFSDVGGARSAYASLISGVVVWAAGEYVFAWPTPYLISLAVALAAYLAARDRLRASRPGCRPPP